MNYRSVVILGKARLVEDPAEKRAALRAFTNHIIAGRWDSLRPVTDQEVAATSVLEVPVAEASAKVRTGPPIDEDEDLSWPVWAGVIPLSLQRGTPVPDAHVPAGLAAVRPAEN
jgi:hypothetical protein